MQPIEHYLGPQYSAAVRVRNVASYLATALLLVAIWIFFAGLVCGTLVHFGLGVPAAIVLVQAMMVIGGIVIVAMLPRIKIRNRRYVGLPIFKPTAAGKDPFNSFVTAPPVTPPRFISYAI
ncbi:MAG TPA: hypothetical protein VFW59_09210 [Gallionella sp.]|nr:hypothetical protein [Gallionella sp.]